MAYLSRALVLNSHRLLLLDILREQKNRVNNIEIEVGIQCIEE